MTNNQNDRKISVSCPKCKRPITFNDPSPPGQLGPPGPPGPRPSMCVVCPSCKSRLRFNPPAPPDPLATPAASIPYEDPALSSPLPPEPFETISPTVTYRATHRFKSSSPTTPTDPDTLVPSWEMPGFVPLLVALMFGALTIGYATRHAMGPPFATLYFFVGALTLAVVSVSRWGWRNYWGISTLGCIFYETLGVARLYFSDHPGEHKYGFLFTMMFIGAFVFFIRSDGIDLSGIDLSSFGDSTGSSCGGGCGGGGCGGGGCGGGGCGG